MGEPITGQWNRIYTAPYSGAAKWGTGINPIHQFYGEGESARVYGRPDSIGNTAYGGYGSPRDFAHTAPSEASPDFIETGAPWGYQEEDIAGLDVFQISSEDENRRGIDFSQDGWPDWSQETPQTRAQVNPRMRLPWNISGRLTTGLLRFGPHDLDSKVSAQVPTETVNEGWLNKAASGMGMGESGDDVIPSDDSQYIIQTSMVQRTKQQNNERALLRGTDDAREPIASRFAPMKLKVYSEGERHYDMFPYQQDDMPRPFWNRTAGTGRAWELQPNEMFVIEPIQRTPPPDPALGPTDQSIVDPNYDPAYGYTSEDQGWY